MVVYRSSSKGNTNGVSVVDDGTYYTFVVAGSTRYKVRKSDGQFLIPEGIDTDAF